MQACLPPWPLSAVPATHINPLHSSSSAVHSNPSPLSLPEELLLNHIPSPSEVTTQVKPLCLSNFPEASWGWFLHKEMPWGSIKMGKIQMSDNLIGVHVI